MSTMSESESFSEEEQVLMDSMENIKIAAPIPCASPLLQLFWDLASLDAGERIEAAQKLIDGLSQLQLQYVKDNSEDIKAKYHFEIDSDTLKLASVDSTVERSFHLENEEDDEEDDDEDEEKDESEQQISDLDILCHEDVVYALKRLTKGLASSRQGARQGFAMALCELLNTVVPFLPPFLAISLVRRASALSGGMKGYEERDMIFGRIFGYSAIIRSGLMQNSLSAANDFKIMIRDLMSFAKKKPYVRESCFDVVQMMLKQLSDKDLKQSVWSFVASSELGTLRNETEISDLTPEILGLLAEMLNVGVEVDFTSVCNLPFTEKFFSPRNYSKMAEVMKESTEFVHPRIHTSWNSLLENLMSIGTELDFQEFWTTIVDEMLIPGSIEKKHLGLKLFDKFVPIIAGKQYQLAVIMTPNLCKCLLNSVENPETSLHKLSKHVIETLRQLAKQDRKLSLQIAAALSGLKLSAAPSGPVVQKTMSSRQIVDDFLANGIEENEKPKMLLEYIKLFCQPPVKDSTDNVQAYDSYRQLCINQICALSKAAKLEGDLDTLFSILQALLVFGFAKVEGTVALLDVDHQVSQGISESIRTYAVTKFWATLGDSVVNLKNCVASESLVVKILEYARNRQATLLSGAIDADLTRLMKKTKSLVQKTKEPNHQQFLIMLSLAALQSILSTDEEKDELKNLLEELVQCFGHMENEAKAAGELNPVDVMTDVFISILAHTPNIAQENSCIGFTTKLWRTLIEAVFKQYCPKLGKNGLESILQVVDPWQQTPDIEESDSESMEEDHEGHDHDHHHHTLDEEESEAEGEVDEELRAKIEAALANGQSVDSDEDLDDEQMISMGFDDKLAEIFRERHLEKKQKSETVKNIVEFRFKVLDLIDVYVKSLTTQDYSASCLPLLADLVLSLIKSASIHSNPAGAISVVQKIKSLPDSEVDSDALMLHLNGVTELSHDVRNQISSRMLGIVKKICKISPKSCSFDHKNKSDVTVLETLWDCLDKVENIMKGGDFGTAGLLALISVPGKESVQTCIDLMTWLLKFTLNLSSKISSKKLQKSVGNMKKRFQKYLDSSISSKRSVPPTIFTNFMQKHVFSAVSVDTNVEFNAATTAWDVLGEPIAMILQSAVNLKEESATKISKFQLSQTWHNFEAFVKYLEVSEKSKEWWQNTVMTKSIELMNSTLEYLIQTSDKEDKMKAVRVKEILLIVHEIVRKNGKITGSKKIEDQSLIKVLEQISTSCYAAEMPAIKQISSQILSDALNTKRPAPATSEKASKKLKSKK